MSTFSNFISRYSNSIFGYSLSRVAYPNTPHQVELGMSDSALRYFPGALKPSCGKKLGEKKKLHNQGKLLVILLHPFPFHAYVFDVSVWVMASLIYQPSALDLDNSVHQEFCC